MRNNGPITDARSRSDPRGWRAPQSRRPFDLRRAVLDFLVVVGTWRSTREISDEVEGRTVSNALQKLQAEGLVEKRSGIKTSGAHPTDYWRIAQ